MLGNAALSNVFINHNRDSIKSETINTTIRLRAQPQHQIKPSKCMQANIELEKSNVAGFQCYLSNPLQ